MNVSKEKTLTQKSSRITECIATTAIWSNLLNLTKKKCTELESLTAALTLHSGLALT